MASSRTDEGRPLIAAGAIATHVASRTPSLSAALQMRVSGSKSREKSSLTPQLGVDLYLDCGLAGQQLLSATAGCRLRDRVERLPCQILKVIHQYIRRKIIPVD